MRSTAANGLVDFLDGGSGSGSGTRGSTSTGSWGTTWESRHTSWGTTGTLVQLGDDGIADGFQLLLTVFVLLLLGQLVGIEPLDGIVALVHDEGLIAIGDLVLQLVVLHGGLHVEAVRLQSVLGRDGFLLLLVLRAVFLRFVDHAFDILLAETALVVGDGDLVFLVGRLLEGSHIQDTVGIDIEGDLNLGYTAGSWWDSGQFELAEQVVVLGHGTFTFEHLDQHTGLVVRVGGEGLGLLGWNGGVTLDQNAHDTSGSFDTERQWSNVKQQQVLHFFGLVSVQDSGLNSSAVGDGFIGIDRLVQLLAVEEVLEELLYLGDTGGSSDKDDVVDAGLVHLGITDGLFDGFHGGTEQIGVQFLETGTGDRGVEVSSLEQRVNLNAGLGRRRQSTLRAFASRAQTTQGALVRRQILLVLALEFLGEVIHQSVVKVLTTKMGVTGGGLDLKDTVIDGQD
ncbi:AAEL016995-PA [Aedes aegypti]|uniref:AAEL016995-PA n=1 Tax=Aedes aegypti TaxID=7159 RepID=J9HI42_AEDAE|nr:AAEL016995-PA [Aedes aegypti]